jgi:chromatin remodeling complex protein RSC6
MTSRLKAFVHFHLLIDMTTTTTTKTTKPTKATLKKLTAIKRTAGKKARSASAKKNALAMKKKGVGIFAPKALSPALATICGAKTLPRTEVTKKIWAYIKKYKLNDGRTIKPDSTLKAIFPVASIDMLKMAGYVSKHLS